MALTQKQLSCEKTTGKLANLSPTIQQLVGKSCSYWCKFKEMLKPTEHNQFFVANSYQCFFAAGFFAVSAFQSFVLSKI